MNCLLNANSRNSWTRLALIMILLKQMSHRLLDNRIRVLYDDDDDEDDNNNNNNHNTDDNDKDNDKLK